MHRTLEMSGPRSSCRSNASKIPRNAASVLPLPVGDVSKIERRSRIAGTASKEDADALAARFHGQVEAGGELVWETLPGNPFSVFGGLSGDGTPV